MVGPHDLALWRRLAVWSFMGFDGETGQKDFDLGIDPFISADGVGWDDSSPERSKRSLSRLPLHQRMACDSNEPRFRVILLSRRWSWLVQFMDALDDGSVVWVWSGVVGIPIC